MKKILMSAGMIVFVGALMAGATGAFFSDSETSTGNVLAAGSIDLGVDNTSYYNGVLNAGTSWTLDYDIDASSTNPRLFFNFDDLKPGDYGEDTISLHVSNNDAWLCADVTLTENDDETCNEPENDADAENGACAEPNEINNDGDLAQELDFIYWADDGDNVLESNEASSSVVTSGIFGASTVGQTVTLSLADSDQNIWGGNGPIAATSAAMYLGKAWCFGTIGTAPITQDNSGNTMTPAGDNNANENSGEPADGGYTCSGAAGVSNSSQTDVVRANVSFRAEQARHNDAFQCVINT